MKHGSSYHYPHHQDPDAFERALRDFLDADSVPAARLRHLPGDAAREEGRESA